MRITDYVMVFPRDIQQQIKTTLQQRGIKGEDLENAMCSRLCDLEEVITREEMEEFSLY